MTGTLAGTGGVFAYVRANRMAEKSTDSSTQSAEVIKSDISETIIGTGNLELADGEAVTVPSGLTVQNVFAESGDSVSKGTVLATLNQSSIQDALQEVQKRAQGYADDATVTTTTNPSEFLDAVFDENGWEFFAEMRRWFDLVRLEKLKDVKPTEWANSLFKANNHYYFPVPYTQIELTNWANNAGY